MALATSWSVALLGMEAQLVRIEADLAQGVPGLAITGLADTALREAKDRIRAAIVNSKQTWPTTKRITLGLSPASFPKRGTGFDLALAAALLAAGGAVPAHRVGASLMIGELGLDGSVRGVPGVLAALLHLQHDDRTVYVAASNLAEARLVPDLRSVGVRSLTHLIDLLLGKDCEVVEPPEPAAAAEPALVDYLDVAGQPEGRLACEVAAAGGHNLFMMGPPGCGKTLLAERLPTILPALSEQEALEVTAIHSIAERLPPDLLVRQAPFQAPHHGSTAASIVGGGSGIAKPGVASLAHRGLLVLDEAPEFKAGVLDALRQPLEHGYVKISRVNGTATYPARFSLVLAANPCPCARTGSDCTCPPERRRAYLGRMSGPVLDRMDITVELKAIRRSDIMSDREGEPSRVIASRVLAARARAARRLAGTPWSTNADVPPTAIAQTWPLRRELLVPVGKAMDKGLLTARGYGRVQRLAWTLADLHDLPEPGPGEVGLALLLRLGEGATRLAAA
jgi:magnesium chelatase family protein